MRPSTAPLVLASTAGGGAVWLWWHIDARSDSHSWVHYVWPLLVLLAVIGIAWALVALSKTLAIAQQALREAESARSHLQAAMEQLPGHGIFSLFDAQDRLVVVSPGYKDLYPLTAALIRPGVAFAELLRHAVSSGEVLEAKGREEQWIQERLQHHQNPGGPVMMALPGDRWVLIDERRLADGSIAGLRTDVTENVRRERALAQARSEAERAQAQLYEALEAVPIGLELFDEQDRLVYFNKRMAEWRPHFSLAEARGKTYAELVRMSLKFGEPAEAIGREEEWLAERLQRRRRNFVPETRPYPDGRWVQVHECATGSGLYVCVRLDVTAEVRQRASLEAARQSAQKARELLVDSIDALPIGIEVFDVDDRLVLHNRYLRHLYKHIDMVGDQDGQTFGSMLNTSLRLGTIKAAIGREAEWRADRLAKRGTHGISPLVQESTDGRWINIYETRTPQGYIVSARMEITDMVRQRQALEHANARLAELSSTDGLTGIANRRRFDEMLEAEWKRCMRHNEPLALIMVDIDHFKRYNDHYGHVAGDECLRQVAQILQSCIRRAGELVARYGGEEFVLLLPSTDLMFARQMARRAIEQLHTAALQHANSPTAPQVTLSMGIASAMPDPSFTAEALIEAADSALYRAKNHGRNRVELANLFGSVPMSQPMPL
ncbi:diguanylate cyclase domain-containing protein [Variovorax sp. HJSM1_2]|uniref:sensor domain-containing diguanylate cyclase n=1 Tax=Variovorax sp. HJSM1_2 TaxID=3366263 RepID=UPI003BDF845F